MPVSVHTILVHGTAVAKSILLPIGMMSEEVQEASNKYIDEFAKDIPKKAAD